MSTAENAKLQYEAGQNATAMSALTNSGDETTFTSGASLWSGKSGYAPVVRPNGLLTGGAVSVNAANDKVTVAALTCNLQFSKEFLYDRQRADHPTDLRIRFIR